LHQHVVPRWNGDANFMPIVARTRTMPALLETTRELVAQAWQRVTGDMNHAVGIGHQLLLVAEKSNAETQANMVLRALHASRSTSASSTMPTFGCVALTVIDGTN
jgi:hypothetical protein